jgi:hypothetical protein
MCLVCWNEMFPLTLVQNSEILSALQLLFDSWAQVGCCKARLGSGSFQGANFPCIPSLPSVLIVCVAGVVGVDSIVTLRIISLDEEYEWAWIANSRFFCNGAPQDVSSMYINMSNMPAGSDPFRRRCTVSLSPFLRRFSEYRPHYWACWLHTSSVWNTSSDLLISTVNLDRPHFPSIVSTATLQLEFRYLTQGPNPQQDIHLL